MLAALAVLSSACWQGFRIFFVPHHRWKAGGIDGWSHPAPYQKLGADLVVFERDAWGGTVHDDFQPQQGDVVVQEHWNSGGFANTDLDLQLKQHRIRQIILIGMIVNTCIEATGRFGTMLGYHVTLVKDATAAWTHEAMHAAHDINGSAYAHAIVTTSELLAQLTA